MLNLNTPVWGDMMLGLKGVLDVIKSMYCIVHYLKYYKFAALLFIVSICGTYDFEV